MMLAWLPTAGDEEPECLQGTCWLSAKLQLIYAIKQNRDRYYLLVNKRGEPIKVL